MKDPVVVIKLQVGPAVAMVGMRAGEPWEWGAAKGEDSGLLRRTVRWRLVREGYGMDGHIITPQSLALDVEAALIGMLGPDAVSVVTGKEELRRQQEERSALIEQDGVIL